jgi:hypothetical protein
MTRKVWTLVTLAVLLGGLSLYLNRDWFSKDTIQIYHRSRPARPSLLNRRRSPDLGNINPLTFGFNRKLRLTAVKVIPLSSIQTNKYPQPIWYLRSDSNSVPTKDFYYGETVRGMRPYVKGAVPDPLEPGVSYRLLVETESFKGEHDFVPEPRTR